MHKRLCSLSFALVTALVTPGAIAQEHRHDTEKAIAKLAAAMAIGPGAAIADVGAGGGDYSLPLARVVGPNGRVVAVDISTRALDRLRARLQREGVANVSVVQGDVDNPKLEPGSLDAVLIVNAYHEMTEFASMLRHIRAALKPGGRLVISDFASPGRRAQPREEQTKRHEIAPEIVLQEMRDAGFRIIGLEDPFDPGHGHEDHIGWLMVLTPAP